MRVGDLVFIRSNGLVPWMIRQITGGTYNHVMLYLGQDRFVSADLGQGVHYAALTDYIASRVAFCRFVGASDAQAEAAVFWAKDQIRKHYDVVGLIGVALRFAVRALEKRGFISFWGKSKVASQNAYFCSELVAEAYLRQGADIAKFNPTYVSPTDLFQAPGVVIIKEP